MCEGPRPIPVAWNTLDRELAAGIRAEMSRRGLGIVDVRKIAGISLRRSREFSAWLRGPTEDYGLRPALAVAEALGVPVRLQVADLDPVVVLDDRNQRRRALDAELAA